MQDTNIMEALRRRMRQSSVGHAHNGLFAPLVNAVLSVKYNKLFDESMNTVCNEPCVKSRGAVKLFEACVHMLNIHNKDEHKLRF